MIIFKVTYKTEKNESYWDAENTVLISASNFSNAEDKAKNFSQKEILEIQVYGFTTKKPDIFILKK